ncbi:MAG: aminotransferase class I/II-fold pyridoxal phosphate-dependent enzyme [Chlamydiota bacterium]
MINKIRYINDFDLSSIPIIETDFLIIGGGAAGFRSAIEAGKHGKTILITKDKLGESNTLYAQGGIAVAMNVGDQIIFHVDDTLKAGDGLCDEIAVKVMIEEGIDRVDELISWGANFDKLNIQAILASKAKVLFLCSPNNPVGSVLSFEDIETVVSQFSGIVVCDEAYIEWSDKKSLVEIVEKYDNLIVLRTFSKIWGLAGIRCGVLIANREIVNLLSFIQPLFSQSDLTADVILSRLKNCENFGCYRSKMIELRNDFFAFLTKLNIVEKTFESFANFLLVKFSNGLKVEQSLAAEKILVANCSNQVANTLRIAIGTETEMERVKKVMRNIQL